MKVKFKDLFKHNSLIGHLLNFPPGGLPGKAVVLNLCFKNSKILPSQTKILQENNSGSQCISHIPSLENLQLIITYKGRSLLI